MPSCNQAPLRTTPNNQYHNRNYTSNSVLDKARGQWSYILSSLGIDHVYLKNKHGVCPVCGGKDRFRYDDKEGRGTFYCNQCGSGDGIKLLRNFHNWNFLETINKIEQILGIKSENNHYNSKCAVTFSKPYERNHFNPDDLKKRRNALIYTWLQTQLISMGDPVDCYLKSRGIALKQFPAALRYHSHLPYYEENKLIGNFPAMVALVRDQNNKGVTLHRTYLGKSCKADVPKPKKLMSSIRPQASVGAAIKLYNPVDSKIVLAEGIETALAIHIATKLPVWATISAGGLEKIILPPSITEVIIAIDNDESHCGQNVGSKLATRLLAEGRKVKRIMPPNAGQDFNDLLLEACK